MLACLTGMLAAAALDGLAIYLLFPLIDLLQGKVPAAGERDPLVLRLLQEVLPGRSREGLMAPYCGVVVVAFLVRAAVSITVFFLASLLTVQVSRNVRENLFHRLLHAPQAVFDRTKTGELNNLFTTNVGWVTMAVENLLQLCLRGSMLVAYLTFVIWQSWQVALLLAGVVVVMGSLLAAIQAPLKRRGMRLGSAQAQMAGLLSDAFGGMRVIRYSGAQEVIGGRFADQSRTTAEADARSRRLAAAVPVILELLALLSVMLIVLIAFFWLIRVHLLAASALLAILVAAMRVIPILNMVATAYGLVTVAAGYMEQLEPWLNLPRFPMRPFGTREFDGLASELRFEDVSFSYAPDKPALSNVSFSVPAGGKVALVGASGSGKSTVAAVLMRLREPDSGRVLLDGTDFWEFSPESWHRCLGVVEQEPFLFHDTIRANIGFGLAGIPQAQIDNALRVADLEKVVAAQPQGLDTVIGERGATLSGGQRQRLAIARAVARDPHLLILDEATSALDTVTEREVQRALDAAVRDRTTLIIAHRLSTVRNADRIVVLDHGRVVEQGSWDELTGRDGPFARLVRLNELKG